MRAASKSLAVGGLLVLLLAAPAAAQYGSPSTTAATPTTTNPAPVQEQAAVNNPTPRAGDTLTVTGSSTAITRQDRVSVVIAPAESGQAKVQPVVTLVDLPGGGVGVSFTVPAGTPSGVYLIAVTVVRPDGTTRTLIVPITVPRNAGGTSFSGVSYEELPDAPALSARTKAAAASIAALGGADAVEKAVLEDGATLRLEGEQLALSFTTGSAAGASSDVDNTRPLTAAAALAAAGGGLVLLRRRQTATNRGIRR